jgi:hypothetical protein
MHYSLGASSKQLTHFFNAQKNLSFFLENNNTVNTYIYSNDREPIRSESFSPPLMYSVTFLEFDEKDSSNQKNNYSASSYMSFNSSFNSSNNFQSKLTSLNSSPTLFSPVLSQHKSKQHLNSAIVFPLLSSLSLVLAHLLTVDSFYTDTKFSDLFHHLAYGSSTFPPSTLSFFSFPNKDTGSPITLQQFEAFHQLSVHVFSSPFSFYYSLH